MVKSKNPIVRKQSLKKPSIKSKKVMKKRLVETAENPLKVESNSVVSTETDTDLQGGKCFEDKIYETIFSKEIIMKTVKVLKESTDAEMKTNKRLLEDDVAYALQVISHQVASIPVHLTTILLPHSIEKPDSEVCIFVKDLIRGRRVDYEPTIAHYEDLLKKNNVERRVTIFPFNKLQQEFTAFEMKRKLLSLYDKFLVDYPIAKHVNAVLGKMIMNRNRSAIPINMAQNLPKEIDKGLRKTFYRYCNSGTMVTITVARHSMTDEQITENIIALIRKLETVHPGGAANIHKLFLKANSDVSTAIPIYIQFAKPEITIPDVIGPKMKKLNEIEEKSKAIFTKFHINSVGNVVNKSTSGKIRTVNQTRKRNKYVKSNGKATIGKAINKKRTSTEQTLSKKKSFKKIKGN